MIRSSEFQYADPSITNRVPGYPGSYENKLSITRVVKLRVFWTNYL
jgi:hypothetical protein